VGCKAEIYVSTGIDGILNKRGETKMGKIRWFILAVFLLLLMSTNVYAVDVNSDELIKNAAKYDGREIIYTGEVIGDVMKRGNKIDLPVSNSKKLIAAVLLIVSVRLTLFVHKRNL
jgi:hypothetical protein